MSMPSLDPEETPPDAVAAEPPSPTASLPPASSDEAAAGAPEPTGADREEGLSSESPAPNNGWTLIALIPHDGREPPANTTDELARAVWCAISALWHPSLLARASDVPRIE